MRGKPLAAGLVLTLVTLAAAGTVIAADAPIDQSTAATSSVPAAGDDETGVSIVQAAQPDHTPPRPIQLGETVLLVLAPIVLGLIIWRKWWRLENPPGHPNFPPMAAVVCYLVIFLLGRIGMRAAMWLFHIPVPQTPADYAAIPLHQQAQLMLGVYYEQFFGLAAFVAFASALVIKRAGPDEQRPTVAKAILIGLAALIVCFPIVNAVGGLAGIIESAIRGTNVDAIAHDTLRLFVQSPVDGWWLTMAGLVIFAAAVVEEFLYRGIVQATLVNLKVGRWPAIIYASTFFAIMHAGVAQANAIVALFALSLVFGWAYERTGRLITSIVMHALFNAANLALAMAWK